VSKELRDLTQHPIDGISIVMDDADLTNITAHINGPSRFLKVRMTRDKKY